MEFSKNEGLVALLFVAVFLFEGVVRHCWGSPLLARASPEMQVIGYALLLATAAGTILWDWQTMGPTLALRHGVLACLLSWLLIVPLSAVSELFIHYSWFIVVLLVGAWFARQIFKSLSGLPAVAGAFCVLLGSFLLATNGRHIGEARDVLGVTGLFLLANRLVRLATSAAADKLEPIETWRGLEKVERDSEEFRMQKELLEVRSAAFADKYDFWLQLADLWRVDPVVGGPMGGLQRTDGGMLLFHGTPRESARGILLDGFRLPDKAGMFGKGIYFADCPLKSWQYTDGIKQIRTGLIFLCWVELGRQSHQKAARNELTRPPHRTFRQWLKREEPYTSVVGDDKDAGGALRVPEYVVYKKENIHIDYICEVRCVPPGTPEEENNNPAV